MKITIVSYDNWGLNAKIVETLKKNGHTVNHINLYSFIYKYPNVLYKIYNFFLKLFSNRNLKTTYYGKEVIKQLMKNRETQDIILVIKGDFIAPKSILELRKYTKKTIGFFNDSSKRCPKIIRVIPNFDEVYSFEKEDCEKYNLKFAPNWIYKDSIQQPNENDLKFKIFNICSIDDRLSILSKIANQLVLKGISYKFIVYDKKNKNKEEHKNIHFITKHLPLSEVENYIGNSEVLLDVNRKKQKGLTFRVFESLGLEKKLITTNPDIKNYDFYNPNNILIVDPEKPEITLDFFTTKYQKLPENILKKYTLNNWINSILKDS